MRKYAHCVWHRTMTYAKIGKPPNNDWLQTNYAFSSMKVNNYICLFRTMNYTTHFICLPIENNTQRWNELVDKVGHNSKA